jgi:two-component system alkaline phosphatase synthesis response regulator PhoP
VKTRYKVLLVDDEKDVLTIYSRSLEQAGYEVVCTEKGVEAIVMVQKEKPDILILDMKLADISGYEVIGRLRGNRETAMIPILAMSGYVEELHRLEDKREDSALASIAKPFKFEDLVAKVRGLLKQEG